MTKHSIMSSVIQWSPLCSEWTNWMPSHGWMSSFTRQDQLQCGAFYQFFIREKKWSAQKAEQYAIMMICKQKYKGIQYSSIHEKELKRAMSSSLFTGK